MKLLFFISKIELNENNKGDLHLHSHIEHEMSYCYEGESDYIKLGDLLFYPAGQKHKLSCVPGKVLKLRQIYFDEDLFSSSVHMEKEALFVLGQIKLYLKFNNSVSLSKIGSERVGKLFESMEWEFKNRYHGYSWTIRLKLIELLVTLMRDRDFIIPIRGEIAKPLSNSHIQDVLFYINTNYMNSITIEALLKFCPLSRSHFHALFKQETGTTFVQYLNEVRCNSAKVLLATTSESILDISLKCGFNNLSHFGHTFNTVVGMTPGSWRKGTAS
ncbi:MAG: helix-turn-helix transcriptional regulator [Spirochaetales bacterium]|nr:helix-turn-helix transcriptional regulator [Spirochaetales bacterium]